VIAGALVAEAVLAARLGFASFEPRQAWLATVTLVVVGACGLLAWLRVPASRIGPLLVAAAVAWGIAVIAGGAIRLPLPFDARLPAEVGLVLVAVLLSAACVRSVERRNRVEDLVVELGTNGGDALTRRLASIVDDPTLQIGYWLPEQDRYVDPTGHPMAPVVEGDRVTTSIDRDGRRVAVLVHARGRLTDPAILDAIGRAADLASTNARLQADVERQRAEVDASRRRLAQAADEEHRSLTHRLEQVLDPRLAELEAALENTSARLTNEPDRGPLAYVRETRRDVAAMANGLAPRAMERGLSAAIAELAERFPIPVTVDAPAEVADGLAHQAALYFVCSEALSNVAKHAAASTVAIRVARNDGRVTLQIDDDGIGGAQDQDGTGLRGLSDRLEAIGGMLTVVSPTGGGTSVRASVPDSVPGPSSPTAPPLSAGVNLAK
jgi:signal transduction histidine kinase